MWLTIASQKKTFLVINDIEEPIAIYWIYGHQNMRHKIDLNDIAFKYLQVENYSFFWDRAILWSGKFSV